MAVEDGTFEGLLEAVLVLTGVNRLLLTIKEDYVALRPMLTEWFRSVAREADFCSFLTRMLGLAFSRKDDPPWRALVFKLWRRLDLPGDLDPGLLLLIWDRGSTSLFYEDFKLWIIKGFFLLLSLDRIDELRTDVFKDFFVLVGDRFLFASYSSILRVSWTKLWNCSSMPSGHFLMNSFYALYVSCCLLSKLMTTYWYDFFCLSIRRPIFRHSDLA